MKQINLLFMLLLTIGQNCLALLTGKKVMTNL